MKKLIALMLIIATLTSCKNDKKADNEEKEGIETFSDVVEVSGKFMYYEDAAVFQTKSELYGVVVNDKLDDLILQSATLKNEPSDEVAVTLKVKTSKKPENEEGWENRIEIIEIIKVSQTDQNNSDIIKLGENQ